MNPISNLVQTICSQKTRRLIMKTILSTLIALSVLTGAAASAMAFDAKSFYEEQDRSRR
jgi:hypothetical protein